MELPDYSHEQSITYSNKIMVFFVNMLLHSHDIKLKKVKNVYIKVTAICPQIPTTPSVTGIKSLFVCLFFLFKNNLWAGEMTQF